MQQTRLEALKLASQICKDPKKILEISERYAQYITQGPKVVDIKPEPKVVDIKPEPSNCRQRRKRTSA
jgi:hypothetical protein